MTYVIAGIYVFLMAVAGRAHGSASRDEVTGKPTGWPTWDRLAATILFGVSGAAVNYALLGMVPLAIAMGALTVLALSTGHGRFFAMNGANINDPNPEQIEKYLVLPWYPGDISKPLYSWVCMGVKGLGVGLAAFPFGLALAFLWPFSYWASTRYTKGEDITAPAEWLRGAFTGAVFVAAYFCS